ncbi:MAG: hypothetical protein H0T62_09975 [Parachlamydiaceae bacterium]|nr:hypothetical protein [Parachlamydiaceae bacterium]
MGKTKKTNAYKLSITGMIKRSVKNKVEENICFLSRIEAHSMKKMVAVIENSEVIRGSVLSRSAKKFDRWL